VPGDLACALHRLALDDQLTAARLRQLAAVSVVAHRRVLVTPSPLPSTLTLGHREATCRRLRRRRGDGRPLQPGRLDRSQR
jgi:hypothetical protein